jgi:antitoxin component of MazEF toxin-antitoxin module
MKVQKWGDDLAIRLSAEVVELLDLKEANAADWKALW